MDPAPTRSSNQATARLAPRDSEPDTDPQSPFWLGAPSISVESDFFGKPIPGHASPVLAQWTPNNLYFLFICPYEELHLKPDPILTAETYGLWNWDVAEVFIGNDFRNIRRYKEFEVSPQAEWVDLDIDLDVPNPASGWVWQSGCSVAARIDASRKTWYGFMRIPYASICARPAATGNVLRINFFRCQGSDPHRRYITWQPTHAPTFHKPESFGTLTLDTPRTSGAH